MTIDVTPAPPDEVRGLRDLYRREMTGVIAAVAGGGEGTPPP
jgi:hypothetical protein